MQRAFVVLASIVLAAATLSFAAPAPTTPAAWSKVYGGRCANGNPFGALIDGDFTCFDRATDAANATLARYNSATGAVRWRTSIPGLAVNVSFDSAYTPTIGVVFIAGYALDATTGAIKWSILPSKVPGRSEGAINCSRGDYPLRPRMVVDPPLSLFVVLCWVRRQPRASANVSYELVSYGIDATYNIGNVHWGPSSLGTATQMVDTAVMCNEALQVCVGALPSEQKENQGKVLLVGVDIRVGNTLYNTLVAGALPYHFPVLGRENDRGVTLLQMKSGGLCAFQLRPLGGRSVDQLWCDALPIAMHTLRIGTRYAIAQSSTTKFGTIEIRNQLNYDMIWLMVNPGFFPPIPGVGYIFAVPNADVLLMGTNKWLIAFSTKPGAIDMKEMSRDDRLASGAKLTPLESRNDNARFAFYQLRGQASNATSILVVDVKTLKVVDSRPIGGEANAVPFAMAFGSNVAVISAYKNIDGLFGIQLPAA